MYRTPGDGGTCLQSSTRQKLADVYEIEHNETHVLKKTKEQIFSQKQTKSQKTKHPANEKNIPEAGEIACLVNYLPYKLEELSL